MTTPTTYNVTVRLHDVAGTAVSPWRNVSATLCDSLMNEVDGFVADDESVVIDRVDAVTDSSGVVTLALIANAEITPAGTYYAIRADGQTSPWLIEATASDDVHALLVTDPDALAPTLLWGHLSDTVDAHDASAISFSPTGTVAATDVQAAIAEVASEKALLAHASQHAGAGSDPITSLGAVSFTGGISLTGTASVADRKITMQSTQVLYYPKHADFPACVFLGNGGGSLAAGALQDTGIGLDSLLSVTSGTDNTAVGTFSLTAVTSGSENAGLGAYALVNLTTGSSNVAVGRYTGVGITTGSGNTVLGAGITGLAAGAANLTLVGYQAGVSNAGTSLTALGREAASTNSGNSVTAVGFQAGVTNAGDDSTFCGMYAGNGNTADFVTAIGYAAGFSNTHANVVLLGRSTAATGAGQFVVGSASYAQTKWIPGHDTDTYLDWGTANTLKVYTGGGNRFSVGSSAVNVKGSNLAFDAGYGPSWTAGSNIYGDFSGTEIVLNPGGTARLRLTTAVILEGSATRLKWGHADQLQTTVGAAGGASALPATPTKYLKVQGSDGTEYVIPAYAAA